MNLLIGSIIEHEVLFFYSTLMYIRYWRRKKVMFLTVGRDWKKKNSRLVPLFFLPSLEIFFYSCSSSRGLETVAFLDEQHTQPILSMKNKNKKIYIEPQLASFLYCLLAFFLLLLLLLLFLSFKSSNLMHLSHSVVYSHMALLYYYRVAASPSASSIDFNFEPSVAKWVK
jgi:hypothetical protein